MSVGNVTQAVEFDKAGITLVLGNNLDLGGDGSRNGTGKTTIVNALSYGLYGSALTNIRKDNLVNKTNNKGMMVTVNFEKDGHQYKIERGRKPNIFKFIMDNTDLHDVETDEMQGEGRLSQQQIENILGMNLSMFKQIVALNTYTEPFLALKANDQRDIIEQLLGITQLSEKSAILKELIKENKESIKEEEFRIKAIKEANEKIHESIKDLERRSAIWARGKEKDIREANLGLKRLENIDIEKEVTQWKKLEEFNEWLTEKTNTKKELAIAKKNFDTSCNILDTLIVEDTALENQTCPTCNREWDDPEHKALHESKSEQLAKQKELVNKYKIEHDNIHNTYEGLGVSRDKPTVHYTSLENVYEHKNSLKNLKEKLKEKETEEDPYIEQIESMKDNALQEVSYDYLNELDRLKEHQEFLFKLLTNKDSFIRKKIINQNLVYLNHRLDHYLRKLGLPHEVKFLNDLSVEITDLGRELDFDNLSRGERNRLILGLSWSFRDVFESLNTPINIVCIDELIDSGMDPNGVEASLASLKQMSRERNKNVMLISHRDELYSRVSECLYVIKENGFTTFSVEKDEFAMAA